MEEALRVCVQEICELISKGSLNPGPSIQVKIWERGSDGHFRPVYREHPTVVLSGLEDLKSFQKCVDQANGDPILGPQLGQLVGSEMSRMQLNLDQILRELVSKMYRGNGQFKFDNDDFTDEWASVFRYLNAETFDFVTVAPLPNISVDFPLKIADSIEIDRLSDDEVNRCVRVGVLRPISPDFELIDEKSAVGLRCTTTVKKIIGKADPIQRVGSFGRRTLYDSATIVDDVLSALRLFESGSLRCPGEVSGVKAWLLSSGHQYRIRALRPFDTCQYELGKSEEESLRSLWEDLSSGTLEQRPFLAMALRRYNMAADRHQLDDRIVDLMIAAEALFLDDAGSPDGRGELRFRLAIRCAKFVDSPRYSPRHVFDLMRKAYDARSRIVHGGTISKIDLPDNPSSNLNEFVSAFEDIMRLGIRKALTDPRIGKPGCWEDLLFQDSIDNLPN